MENLAKAVAENAERLEAASSKERLETWKFAAEEIVDLLKTVRQEGEGGSYTYSIVSKLGLCRILFKFIPIFTA